MTVEEVIKNALTLLESLGYVGGDIHDNLESLLYLLDDSNLTRELTEEDDD